MRMRDLMGKLKNFAEHSAELLGPPDFYTYRGGREEFHRHWLTEDGFVFDELVLGNRLQSVIAWRRVSGLSSEGYQGIFVYRNVSGRAFRVQLFTYDKVTDCVYFYEFNFPQCIVNYAVHEGDYVDGDNDEPFGHPVDYHEDWVLELAVGMLPRQVSSWRAA